jgi:pyrimidine-specific ribonucleoside hydrolase
MPTGKPRSLITPRLLLYNRVVKRLFCVLLFGLFAAANAATAAAAATPVSVTITTSSCRLTPARVPAGAVQFAITNRSQTTQRFLIGGRSSTAIGAGRRGRFSVTLGEPSVYPYRCVPKRGIVRRGSMRVARSVVIETDMAADDVMAILYLLGRPDVDVRAIAVDGTGEVHCPIGAAHARSVVEFAGRADIPVSCGRTTPLQGTHAFPITWRAGVDGFFRMPLPGPRAAPTAGTAEQLITTAVLSAPGLVDVLTLGPPTELAAALSASPALSGRIRAVTMMGGAVAVPGNLGAGGIPNAYAEWNFCIDPRAVNIVFRSGAPIRIVPLDATRFAPVSADVATRLSSSARASLVRRLILEWMLPAGSFDFWDPLAAAALVDPSVVTYSIKRLAVVESEGPEVGRVVETAGGPEVQTAVSADRARFEQSFVAALR